MRIPSEGIYRYVALICLTGGISLLFIHSLVGKFCTGNIEGEKSDLYHVLARHQSRLLENALPRGWLFFGDSFVAGVDVRRISQDTVNLGIGGDTIIGMLERICDAQGIRQAAGVIFSAGINDLKYREIDQIVQNFGELLSCVPVEVRVVVVSVAPVADRFLDTRIGRWTDNTSVQKLNAGLLAACRERVGCSFADAFSSLADDEGNLIREYGESDGLHLSAEGYVLWSRTIRDALSEAGDRGSPDEDH